MPLRFSGLGDLERAVMDTLWAHGPGLTVREVHERLSDRDLAYTTVMTVLDRLAKKDLTTREREGRAWRYSPAHSREELTAASMRSGLQSLDSTDRRQAMLHFLGDAEPGEIADLKAALAEVERRHD
ncbi:BlaI/MecI/CopY family transcriptional regulator [Ornithinimicrobium sediminis]|uniref:BlaI/MecI/CopY family transcriptional regulator n=1 Tax=Ornithinimicrobium sediminis TaxID=2904603 RepID=UPI001E5489B7|nr:BlaI/MecI/CopY family transcriptional regulator [Ornithinimicrobium sediminis]MCE0486782.1 BlaI/MecI/CopY family transcriptional regulator [Ornithinimicrobium sediminis]